MNQAQGAQGLDECEFTPVKRAHLLVAIEQRRQLLRALTPLARQQHPQILHRRATAGIVQVHKVRATAPCFVQRRPQNIAGVAIAMQAQLRDVFPVKLASSPLLASASSYQFKSLIARLLPGSAQLQRNHVLRQQPVARFLAELLQVQRRAHLKIPLCPHAVQAGDKAAQPLQHLKIVQLRQAPTAPGADAEGKTRVLVQRGPVQQQRRHHRHFGHSQLGGKSVLLQNVCRAPAPRAVELGHHARAVFQRRLVHAVFVRRQGQ